LIIFTPFFGRPTLYVSHPLWSLNIFLNTQKTMSMIFFTASITLSTPNNKMQRTKKTMIDTIIPKGFRMIFSTSVFPFSLPKLAAATATWTMVAAGFGFMLPYALCFAEETTSPF